MSVPLIVAPIVAAGSRGERAQSDPVRAGFEDFAEVPGSSRLLVARKVFEVATMGSELPREIVEQYAGDIATAAVATASSTGVSKVPPALLFRSAKRHYEHETECRIVAELEPLKQELDRHAAGMRRSERRKLRDVVFEHNLGGRRVRFNSYTRDEGFRFAYDFDRPIEDAAQVAAEEDLALEAFDVQRPKLFAASPEAREVALGGLGRLYSRVNNEVSMMHSTVQAVRELIPDFATNY